MDTRTDDSDAARASEIELALEQLRSLRADIVGSTGQAYLEGIHATYRESALNLQHYLALRSHDIRPLQVRLAKLGLSSLGRSETHVLAAVDAVLAALHAIARRTVPPQAQDAGTVNFETGQQLLLDHTELLFGPAPAGRQVRIMVTMPTEAASEYTLVHNLLEQGMDGLRINCAHDDAPTWKRMIENLHRAEQALGRRCRVVMDLAGPKLRTGPLEAGPAVVHVRPQRDAFGRVLAPARLWLTPDAEPQKPPTQADVCLPVPAAWLQRLRVGQSVQLVDARGARRTLVVRDATPAGCWLESLKAAFITPGTLLHHDEPDGDPTELTAPIGDLPRREAPLVLRTGDLLVVTRNLQAGRPAAVDSAGRVLTPATIGCSLPEVFEHVRSGEAIWFDDGKIGGVIETVEHDRVLVRITRALPGGGKLRSDKGINLPDSELPLAALTSADLEDLAFAAEKADVVELSFANSARDVVALQAEIRRRTARTPAIVLKIETRRGFENLPEMLLAAMRWPCCGVMIARGDLAVECGFERLAEVQEEILWICEAAHVPVIWATQVLETLAKTGIPSRAEITDAAMGHRAECVMLNKGPHMVSAVRVLDDILRRMESHQAKKRAMLRKLRLAHQLGLRSKDG